MTVYLTYSNDQLCIWLDYVCALHLMMLTLGEFQTSALNNVNWKYIFRSPLFMCIIALASSVSDLFGLRC